MGPKQNILILLQCDPDAEFTCDDGTCISIDERCDEISNCLDGSDEDRCEIVIIDGTSYRKQHPPLNVQGNVTANFLNTLLHDNFII